MSEVATLETVLAEIRALRKEQELSTSPWCRGDREAAIYSGFRSIKAFRAWAKQNNIRPNQSDGMNFWDKTDIRKARQKKSYF